MSLNDKGRADRSEPLTNTAADELLQRLLAGEHPTAARVENCVVKISFGTDRGLKTFKVPIAAITAN